MIKMIYSSWLKFRLIDAKVLIGVFKKNVRAVWMKKYVCAISSTLFIGPDIISKIPTLSAAADLTDLSEFSGR